MHRFSAIIAIYLHSPYKLLKKASNCLDIHSSLISLRLRKFTISTLQGIKQPVLNRRFYNI